MYKLRFSFKNIILRINNLNVFLTSSFSGSANLTSKLKFQKVLVVSKLTFYEFERTRYNFLNDDQFKMELESRGTDYERLTYFHNLHKTFENRIISILNKAKVDVKIVNRINYTDDLIHWADVIIPTGGDGTFLLAASRIRDNKKPVIGFNSDPNRSEGHLCLPKDYSLNLEDAISRLKLGQFNWLLRNRIRTTLYGQKGEIVPTHLHSSDSNYKFHIEEVHENLQCSRVLPFLALNEVFMGECLSARVSHLEMWLNGSDQPTNMKCSGLCIATGTGSTSWNLSINRLTAQSIAELLNLLNIDVEERVGTLASRLADTYNKNLIFAPEDKRLGYTIRDLISAGVWPQPKGIKSRGFASTIKVKSKCIDACLVVDGGISIPFNDGCIAILEIKPEDALRTVEFVN